LHGNSASDFAIGAILSQLDEDEIWKPVAFMSKLLNKMLAMMQGFYEWSHYLKGTNNLVEVLTNHQNLTYF
jgi:hypothetical protein